MVVHNEAGQTGQQRIMTGNRDEEGTAENVEECRGM